MTSIFKVLLCIAVAASPAVASGRSRGHANAGHGNAGHAGHANAGHGHASTGSKEGKSYSTIVPVTTYEEACPTGYDQEGDDCVKTIETPVIQKCPPGSLTSGSSSGKHGHHGGSQTLVCRVVKTAAVESVCPLGYEVMGSACSKSEIAAEEESCPHGYEAVDGECIKADTFAPVHVCPSGTTKKHNNKMVECLNIQHEDPTHVCPADFELQGDHCLRKTAASPLKYCTSGYEMVDDECVKEVSISSAHECPEGFVKYGSKCQAVTSATPEAVCEEGYELLGNTCMRKEQAEYLQSCPKGYEETAEGCTMTSNYPIKRACPHGSHAHNKAGGRHGGGHGGHHMECTKITVETAQMVCPEGFEMSPGTNHCILSESAEEEIACPVGFEMLDDECVKMEIHDMYKKCPSHTKKEGDQCVVTETAPLTSECPDSTHEVDGKCVSEETADKEMSCKSGYTLSEQVGPDGGALCEKCADEKHHKSTGACSYVPGTYHCPTGYTKKIEGGSKTDCYKVIYSEHTKFCPEGFESPHGNNAITPSGTVSALHHNRNAHGNTVAVAPTMTNVCARKSIFPEEEYCPQGFEEVDGKCQKHHKHAVSRSCPGGFSHHGHGGGRHGGHGGHHGAACTRMTTKLAAPTCPEGFSLQQTSCIKHTDEAPEESCPTGSELVGEQCVIVKTAPFQYACPAGYIKSSKGGSDCYKKVLAKPSHVCQDGYELKGDKCIHTEEAEMLELCKDGSEPVDGKCLSSTTKTPSEKCPEGFTKELNGKFDCTKLEKATPEKECQAGFELEGHHCTFVENVEPEIECPAGAIMADDGTSCVLKKTQLLQHTCPSGFSKHGHGAKGGHHGAGGHHHGEGCSKLLTAQATYACPEGYTLSTSTAGSSRMRGSSAPIQTCTTTEILAPEISCANNAMLVGDSCQQVSRTPLVKRAVTTMKRKTKQSYYSDI